jgi:AcrR family transcriptional regulator
MTMSQMSGRARLSQADYVTAAFQVADERGLQSLTLKALGQHLGVDSTAVYRHFRSKDVLLLAMLDRLLVDVLEPPAAHASPRDELVHIVGVLRTVLLRHPPLAVALAAINEPAENSAHLSDRVVDALARMGLHGEALVVHYQLIEHFVLGACLFDGDGAPDNWAVRRRRYERIGSREFRAAARSDGSVRRVADEAFTTGMTLLLDACEASAATVAAPGH